MISVLLVSLVTRYLTRETLPRQVRIATGSTGGLYHDFTLRIKKLLEDRFSLKVELVYRMDAETKRTPEQPPSVLSAARVAGSCVS